MAAQRLKGLAKRVPGVRGLVAQRDALRQLLDSAVTERDELRRDLDEATRRADELTARYEAEHRSLREELERLREAGAELEEARNALVVERDELKLHLGDLQRLVDDADTARDVLLTERDALKRHFEEAQEQAGEAAAARDAIVAERDALKRHLDDVQEQAGEAAAARDAILAERNLLRQHVEHLGAAAERAGIVRDELMEERDALQQQLVQLASLATEADQAGEAAASLRQRILAESSDARSAAVVASMDEIRAAARRVFEHPGAGLPARRNPRPVFIVAQYKSGTSWLLSALAAHPEVTGVREVDIIRAAYRFGRRSVAPAPVEHRLSRLFGVSSWCLVPPLEALAIASAADPKPFDSDEPQAFADLERDAALMLFREALEGEDPHRLLDAFLAAMSSRGSAPNLVLKAADQIWHFEQLEEWQPDAVKIAITRDGRDAAISAVHYKRLMEAQSAPWSGGSANFARLLHQWSSRAARIADLGRSGQVYVLRYEDLSRDFAGTFGALAERLGLDHSADVLAAIEAKTSFEARTGRPRGSEGAGVLRKGAVGEWQSVLEGSEAESAWRLAGPQLIALGYTEDGSLAPLPDDVAPVTAGRLA